MQGDVHMLRLAIPARCAQKCEHEAHTNSHMAFDGSDPNNLVLRRIPAIANSRDFTTDTSARANHIGDCSKIRRMRETKERRTSQKSSMRRRRARTTMERRGHEHEDCE
jgi:hypothetical protein